MRLAALSHSVDCASCSASVMSASFFERFSDHSCLRSFRSSCRRGKNLSQGARKRSQTDFSGPRGTAPIWQISSAVAALVFSVYIVTLGRRRQRLNVGRPTAITYVNFLISISATVALWLNAAGFWFEPGVGPYALALTWYLVLGGWVFLLLLESFIRNTD